MCSSDETAPQEHLAAVPQCQIYLPLDPPGAFPGVWALVAEGAAEAAEVAETDSVAERVEHLGEAVAFGAGEEALRREFAQDKRGRNHVQEK